MNKNKIIKILLALLGIAFIGIGVAFNASTKLGNDPIGIIYDGLRNQLNLSGEELGVATNIINYGLIIVLLFIGRRYVNIGTLIYILPYGLFVKLGTILYDAIFTSQLLTSRVTAGVIGTLLIFTGVGIYIAVDIGLDPFSGIVMVIRDKLKWDYRRTKILFDIVLIILGTVMGGKLGIITLVTAFSAGPSIQAISNQLRKVI